MVYNPFFLYLRTFWIDYFSKLVFNTTFDVTLELKVESIYKVFRHDSGLIYKCDLLIMITKRYSTPVRFVYK